VRVQQLWCTLLCSIGVLSFMLILGVIYLQYLPLGITSQVGIVTYLNWLLVFSATLEPAGLSGAIIEWHDGLLELWQKTFLGVRNLSCCRTLYLSEFRLVPKRMSMHRYDGT
jgi:hypothetical protein